MSKRVVAIGLLTMVGDVVVSTCTCCQQPFQLEPEATQWGNLGLEFCSVCCLVRCDAYPGECPNKDSLAKPWGGSSHEVGPLTDKVI